jgi:outer membrane protein OmpA-like peptidoglycan-associated protein
MDTKYSKQAIRIAVTLFSVGMVFGCANYEVNSKRGNIPGHYIRHEMQDADRAVESARMAGKDKICPDEFKAAEEAKNHAYDVFRACRTEEGAALAKLATAQANALCPVRPKTETKAIFIQPAPVIILAAEPMAKEKVVAAAVEPKVVVLAFQDIHFNFDQSTLTPEAKLILKRDILLLKENSKTKIRVAGYTSASGTEEYNQKLSERRAKAVQDYLIDEGVISRDRLSTIGYGETHPAVHEAAPKNLYSVAAKENMRVLFEIVVE